MHIFLAFFTGNPDGSGLPMPPGVGGMKQGGNEAVKEKAMNLVARQEAFKRW